MDKKKLAIKIIIIICIIAIITALIILLLPKENTTPTIVSKPINETVNLELVFEKIEEVDGMAEYIVDESGDVVEEDNQIKYEEEIDFAEYEILEKKALVKTTEDSINEVWMIKLGSYDQQEEVCRILGNRVQKLKNAFKDDATQSTILKEAVIKQEDGIVIMIISPYANKIEETIANEM